MMNSTETAPTPFRSLTRIEKTIPLAAAVFMFIHAFALRYTPDDAYIAFRYALNLARGLGPVFNVGQHVEGYTSPFFVFTLGLLTRIGLPLETVALFFSMAGAVLAVYFLPRLSRQLGFRLWGLDALLLAANTSFAVWAGASMEMTVFAFVLVLAVMVFVSEKRYWLAGLLFAILALIRPEGLFFGGLAVVFAFWPFVKREPGALKNWITLTLVFAVPVFVHLAWRLSYYGYPLPNTFYDKVGFSLAQALRGAHYVADGAWTFLLPLALPLLAGLTAPMDRKRLYVALGMLGYVTYVAVAGGDWMVSFRLITPAMPLIALFSAVGVFRIGQWVRGILSRHATWLRWSDQIQYASAFVGVIALLTLDLAPSFTVVTDQPFTDSGKPIAQWLTDHCPTTLKLAVYAAGAVPYYASDFQIVDMFGLTDSTIGHLDVPTIGEGIWAGHEKFSAQLVRKQNPNIYIFQGALGDKAITSADAWHDEPPAGLTRQFTDDIDFWADHSAQTAPMPGDKHFNIVILNPYPCR